MKPIDQMTLAEVKEEIEKYAFVIDNSRLYSLLDQLDDLTRWIPVSERMPTEEDYSEAGQIHLWDAEFGICRVYHKDIAHDFLKRIPLEFTHWQRITPPTNKETKL
jgi:hypothetical protein